MFNQLINNKNHANEKALEIMEKSNVLATYHKFMKRNNSNKAYDEIQKSLKRKNNAQITDLMNAIKKFGNKNKI